MGREVKLLSRAEFRPVNALLLTDCKAIVAHGGTHLVLLFKSGKREHSFAQSRCAHTRRWG
jgi:hypothetical protein